MNKCRCFLCLLFIQVFFYSTIHSQSPLLDSLKQVLKTTQTDTAKCRVLMLLIDSEYDDDVWPVYNKQVEEISLKNLENAKLDSTSKRIFKVNLGASYTNTGYITKQHGDIHTALDYYYKGLKILEEIGDKKGRAEAYNNIAFIYKSQDEPERAKEYFNKSLVIFKEINDKTLINSAHNNLGYINEYMAVKEKDKILKQSLFDTALYYYNLTLLGNTELKNNRGLAFAQYNIGYLYLDNADTTKAFEYFEKSLTLRRELNDKRGIAQTINIIGLILFERGNVTEALKNVEEGFKLAKENGMAKEIENSSKALSKIYAKTGNWRGAYEMQMLYKQMSDSISNETNQKELFQKGYQYEYEKKAAADSIRAHEEKKVIAIQLKQERTQRLALYGGLALVLVFAGFIFNRFKTTQKQNRIIHLQKEKVEKQKDEIEHQKELVDEKQKEILDSITYAKRLQTAILPPAEHINKVFPNNFVLYKPKDIVAGDFYWMHVLGNDVWMAAADSTGHGVPGAMVSIVCSNALDKSVKEFGLKEPGEILDKTRELVLETFAKSGEDIKDGMDISLIRINHESKKITWSGANNQLWYITKLTDKGLSNGRILLEADSYALIEIKADKQPVGMSDHGTPFRTHTVEWLQGTIFFLITDGFPDQFGGIGNGKASGKKYKSKRLAEKLISLRDQSMNSQKNELFREFEEWRGPLEQIDDVTIIGIKI